MRTDSTISWDWQPVRSIGALVDVDETARALVWLDERYLSEALGREPQADPELVVEVLHRIWMSTLYGTAPSR